MLVRKRNSVVIVLSVLALSSCTASPRELKNLAISEHFDGKRFYNREAGEKSFTDVLKMGISALTESASWPEWVDDSLRTRPAKTSQELVITFINHASVLLQVDGKNILTDPIYSQRASPVSWAGPKRVREPGVLFADLPNIDFVVISHDHYDHLDLPTLQQLLAKNPKMLILAPVGNQKLLTDNGLAQHQLFNWDEQKSWGPLTFIFTEARHRTGRGISDHFQSLWGSWVIRHSMGQLYFAGDTGYGRHFRETHSQYGDMQDCLLPVGAYEPRWFMQMVHLNPEEAVLAHKDLHCQRSIGIHMGTFQLTFESIDQPRIDLEKARNKHHIGVQAFAYPQFGEVFPPLR